MHNSQTTPAVYSKKQNGVHNHSALDESGRSRRATFANACGLFTPHLLNLNPTNKSGSFLIGYGFEDNPLVEHKHVITEWYQCLKSHPNFKPIHVNENASTDEVLEVLKTYTDRLLRGYKWELNLTDPRSEFPDINLLYWKDKGEVDYDMLPLKWLQQHPDKLVGGLSLQLLACISNKFRIDMVRNSATEYAFQEWENESELITYIQDNLGFDDNHVSFKNLYDTLWSYHKGPIKTFEKQMAIIGRQGVDFPSFNRRLGKLKLTYPDIYKWLQQGALLLRDLPEFNTQQYHFQTDKYGDERGLNNFDLLFFPYEFHDHIFDNVDQHINDTAANFGIEHYYEWGYLDKENNHPSMKIKPMKQLSAFIQQGRKIYFKTEKNEHPRV